MSLSESIQKMATGSKTNVKVSVIIPTYKDWDRLTLLLDSLKLQTYPHQDFEVIIVNNDPESSCPISDMADNVALIDEAMQGSYAARNAGVLYSSGKILVFTDSDCIADPLWLEKGVELVEQGCERVAGHIELVSKAKTHTAAEIYSKAFVFDQQKRVAKGLAVTANLFVKRSIFLKAGLFNDKLLSGGDFEWNERASKLGVSIVYSPDAIVRHPTLTSFAQLMRKEKRIAGGVVALKKIRGEGLPLFPLIRNLFPPIRVFFRLIKKSDLTAYEAFIAFSVHYFLNIYKQYSKFFIYIRLYKPTRC